MTLLQPTAETPLITTDEAHVEALDAVPLVAYRPRTAEEIKRQKFNARLAIFHPRMWGPITLTLVVLGGLWTWGAAEMPYLLPPLSEVWSAVADQPGYFLDNATITLIEALLGLIIGFTVAIIGAVLISEFPMARRAIMPVAVVLNVTPLVAIAPALVVAFGFGAAPKLILTSLICFFPILINTAVGLQSVPKQVLQVYSTMSASRWEVLRYLRMPSALPYIFASLRIVFPLSVVGAVVAELSAAGSAGGLGTVIQVSTSMNRMDMVWSSIGVLAVMGSLLLLVVTVVERRALHWHESQQN